MQVKPMFLELSHRGMFAVEITVSKKVMIETTLKWQEFFSQFQDTTDAFPC